MDITATKFSAQFTVLMATLFLVKAFTMTNTLDIILGIIVYAVLWNVGWIAYGATFNSNK